MHCRQLHLGLFSLISARSSAVIGRRTLSPAPLPPALPDKCLSGMTFLLFASPCCLPNLYKKNHICAETRGAECKSHLVQHISASLHLCGVEFSFRGVCCANHKPTWPRFLTRGRNIATSSHILPLIPKGFRVRRPEQGAPRPPAVTLRPHGAAIVTVTCHF